MELLTKASRKRVTEYVERCSVDGAARDMCPEVNEVYAIFSTTNISIEKKNLKKFSHRTNQ